MKRLLLVSGALLLLASLAAADKPRCRLERVVPADEGVRAYASVVELEGVPVDGVRPVEFTLYVDKKPLGKGKKAQAFASAKEQIIVALVVEIAAQYKKVLEQVAEALRTFLEEQPTSMKVTLITFGSELEKRTPKPIGAPMMSGELDNLSPDDDSADVRMVDAIRMAMGELKKFDPKDPEETPPRRVIVLVSDGLNAKMDRNTFKKLGDELRTAHIPIHTIAYSPIDERGPLLNLGELSKRSFGTFRWAQKGEDLKEQLDNLGAEVRKQYVITFGDSVSGKHKFSLQCRDLRSNVYGVEIVDTGWAWWMWVLAVIGGIVLLLGLLFLLGTVLTKRAARAEREPGQPKPVKAPKPAKVTRPASGGTAQRAAAAAPAPRAAQLIGVSGALSGQRFPVGAGLSIGKAPGHGISVAGDGSVSSNHCEIRHDGRAFVVRDLGSTNGTFVNGQRIAGPQLLRDGDLVRCGIDTQFKVRID